jgi:hypothetical protein
MKQRRRICYSAAQRSEIWDRWQAGEPMSSIGRRFDRESSSIFSVISPTGGIRPRIGAVPNRRSAFLNGRRSREGSACAARCGRSRVTWDDPHQPSAVNPAQWRGGLLSGCGFRSGRMGSGAAPQALQAGLPSVLEADSINLAAAAMVTGASCRLAQAHKSGGT